MVVCMCLHTRETEVRHGNGFIVSVCVLCFVCLGIDDEPEDGPQRYILVQGFYQPHLIGELDAVGVHVANVIKLCSEHTQTSDGPSEQHTCEGNEQSQRASPVLDAGKGL